MNKKEKNIWPEMLRFIKESDAPVVFGENVAETIVKARRGGPFISVEDLRERGKVNTTSLDKLKELGCLDNMSESNQLSLF